ncbi:transposase [Streptomyces malaysiensis]|uniref:transposase n=1 Tax=Streptomyces malaysiensis TaxID=92644 RepID=UPI003555FC36
MDEFALRKGHRYATIITDASTGERIDVLPDRRATTVTAWRREHPGIQAACRDGVGGFAQAITDADLSCRWPTAGTCGMDSSKQPGNRKVE